MKKELNILVIFFVLAVTPLALYFSQQQQSIQQQASELPTTIELPTEAPTETPFPTAVPSPTAETAAPRITTPTR